MNSTAAAAEGARRETGLREFFEVVWRDKWIVVVITAVFAVSTAVAAMLTPRKWTATVILAVVSNKGGGLSGGGGVLSSIGGLALPGLLGHDSEKAESLAVLQSDTLTTRYIREHNLLPVLYAKQWDPIAKQWRVQKPSEVPTMWRATQKFKDDIRNVNESTKTGLVTMTITWDDPQLAAKWANDLVELTNDAMRERAIADSERNIAYLNEQAAKTDVSQVRAAVYAILESEIRHEMIARGTQEYALRVLDPAVAPEVPSSPRRTVWVIVSIMAGVLMSLLVVFLRESWLRGSRTYAQKGQ